MALAGVPETRRRRPPRWVVVSVAATLAPLLLLVLLFTLVLPAVARHSLLAPGSTAPPIHLGGLDPVADSTHHTVVVEFFSTTCSDCAAENSLLCSFVSSDPGAELVEIEAGGHTAADVARWKAALGDCGTHIGFLVDSNGSLASAYHVLGTPTLYVIRGGVIAAAAAGIEDPKHLLASVPASP